MAELIGVIQRIVQNTIQAMKLTDMSVGTVVSVSPLGIQTDTGMPMLTEAAVTLTDAVRERIVPVQGGEGGNVTVAEGLKPGDRVLMLRVKNGNQYLVLSRLA